MGLITDPLRDEHRELLPHIDALRATGDAVGDVPIEVLRTDVDDAYTFLVEHLIPHATGEDQALYPVVGRLLGAPRATATMERDHVAVSQLTAELDELRLRLRGEPTAAELKALRRVLYGLYTLVSVHFAKEEEVYLPFLDTRLSPAEARELFERVEVAVAEARGATHAH